MDTPLLLLITSSVRIYYQTFILSHGVSQFQGGHSRTFSAPHSDIFLLADQASEVGDDVVGGGDGGGGGDVPHGLTCSPGLALRSLSYFTVWSGRDGGWRPGSLPVTGRTKSVSSWLAERHDSEELVMDSRMIEGSPHTTCPTSRSPGGEDHSCQQDYRECDCQSHHHQTNRSQHGILNPFFRFIHRFSGE